MSPELVVLGVAQDGGHPHPGCRRACCRSGRHLPACAAVVDGETCWMIDATPALPEQLDRVGGRVDGLLLTHAHMGHYTGLVWLGREGMGVRAVPVHLMPRLAEFLRTNGPWSQLVALGNVELRVGATATLGRVRAEALVVPHRDEYSETVAWRLVGPSRAALWLPDIDGWEGWDLEGALARVDAAWIDGTFWDDGELGRDMAEIPHPRVRATIERLGALPASERAKVRFVHLNHTNPLLDPGSSESAAVRAAGMAVAWEGERFAL